MILSQEKLLAEAAKSGYRPEMLEKVIRLLDLLGAFRGHPVLKDALALKGGTALNVFEFPLPRLSVDIDLNYVGAQDLETTQKQRPAIEKAVTDICALAGLTVEKSASDEHAGGKWRLRYTSALGNGANLEVDLNFLLRIPLWPIVVRDSQVVGSYEAKHIPILDVNELAAGKLVALLSRHVARDLFDSHQLLTSANLDDNKLRLGFILYGAASRQDWRKVSPESVGFEARELRDNLVPVLSQSAIAKIKDTDQWAKTMVEECQAQLGRLLPLNDGETEFLNRLLDHGEIKPAVLTSDSDMAAKIEALPTLRWKAMNVQKMKKQKAP
jgi:predicted nucleotidyltransferase component of viral defense system